jgi:hypothetical protein
MVIKTGRFGKFLAWSRLPGMQKYQEDHPGDRWHLPLCGGKVLAKNQKTAKPITAASIFRPAAS